MFKFADPLYNMHDECLDILRHYGITPKDSMDKRLLQLLGTEWARETYGQDIWRNVLQNRIDEVREKFRTDSIMIINDDLRFRNEVLDEALTVRLEAPEEVRRTRTDSWREQTKHISETDLDDYRGWDLVLDTHLDSVESNLEKIMALVSQGHLKQGDSNV